MTQEFWYARLKAIAGFVFPAAGVIIAGAAMAVLNLRGMSPPVAYVDMPWLDIVLDNAFMAIVSGAVGGFAVERIANRAADGTPINVVSGAS